MLALALAGCGRKGGLDPPPGAVLDPALTSNMPPPEAGPDGRTAPSTPARSSPLDFLLD
jgi:predicted small lipoprotein YifL